MLVFNYRFFGAKATEARKAALAGFESMAGTDAQPATLYSLREGQQDSPDNLRSTREFLGTTRLH